jgi:pseudouridine-5'-phosphate glycosidase
MAAEENAVTHPACCFCSFCRAAQVLAASLNMNLGTGAVLAVPIPAEHAAEGEVIEAAIKQALREADEKGVAGSQVRHVP